MMIRYCAGVLMIAWTMLGARADVASPQLTTRVTDLTGTLSGETVNRLELKLGAFQAAHGFKVSVLIVPTTQPVDIEQYPIPVAADGVVLLVAKNERRVHIDVGPALAGTLPEAVGRRIVGESLTPHFEVGDFDGGVEAAANTILAVLQGDPLPEADKRWADHEVSWGGGWSRFLALGVVGAGLTSLLLLDRTRGWTAGASGWDYLGRPPGGDPEFRAGGASGRW